MNQPITRRQALKSAAFAAAAASVVPSLAVGADPAPAKPESPDLLTPATVPSYPDRFRGLKVGCASYSFRKLPVDATIKGIQRVQLAYVSIKDFHLSLKSTAEERKAVAQKFRDAGIKPISCGVISLKGDEAALRNAFEYTRDVGAPTMVCSPDPKVLPVLDRLVKEFDIRLAIHNHGPEDKVFPSPYEVMEAVKGFDDRIGLCNDVGHTARAGHDPAKAIRDLGTRLYDVHFKDIAAKDPKAHEIEVGRGVLDVRAMLQALLDVKFAGHVGFEHENDAADPLPGLAESVGYTKGTIAGLA